MIRRQGQAGFDDAGHAMYRVTADGHFLLVNPALVTMLGYESAADLMAVNIADLYRTADDTARLMKLESHLAPDRAVEVGWRRKDGSPLTVRLSGWPVSDEQGRTTAYEMVVEDVSEYRALELGSRAVIQSQRLEAIGRLAGGVAHDFNNLLTTINGFAQIVLEALPPDDPLGADVKEIITAGERAAALTGKLLAFSRRQILQPQVLNLTAFVDALAPKLREIVSDRIDVVLVPGRTPSCVRIDPVQFEHVLVNLAVNVREAIPERGRLSIETSTVNLDDDHEYVRVHPDIQPGRYVLLSVTDDGGGIDEETRAHIFEPFFTTKPKEKGTGLGLSTVYGIVAQSGGSIAVESEAGRGTTFRIYLPEVEERADVQTQERSTTQPRGSETILIVDDEDSIRQLAGQLLRRAGYTVLEASGGEDALRHCREHAQRIDLMLTDVAMPGMNGRDVAAHVASLRPEIKVLYMSGYADHAIVHDGVLEAGLAFLPKPLTLETLTRKVRSVLDGT